MPPIADKNYYVDVDNNIVPEGDPKAHKLLVAKGGRIDQKVADRHGMTGLIEDEHSAKHTLSAKIRAQTEAEYEAMERDGLLPPGLHRGHVRHALADETDRDTAEAMGRQSQIYSRPNPVVQEAAEPTSATAAGVSPFGGHESADSKNLSLVAGEGTKADSSASGGLATDKGEGKGEGATSESNSPSGGEKTDPVADSLAHQPPTDLMTGKPTDQAGQPLDQKIS